MLRRSENLLPFLTLRSYPIPKPDYLHIPARISLEWDYAPPKGEHFFTLVNTFKNMVTVKSANLTLLLADLK